MAEFIYSITENGVRLLKIKWIYVITLIVYIFVGSMYMCLFMPYMCMGDFFISISGKNNVLESRRKMS